MFDPGLAAAPSLEDALHSLLEQGSLFSPTIADDVLVLLDSIPSPLRWCSYTAARPPMYVIAAPRSLVAVK